MRPSGEHICSITLHFLFLLPLPPSTMVMLKTICDYSQTHNRMVIYKYLLLLNI